MFEQFSVTQVGAIGYAVSSALYGVFAVLLLTGWHGRLKGMFLVAAVAVSIAWSVWFALPGLSGAYGFPGFGAVEVVRFAAWLFFLFAMLGYVPLGRRALSASRPAQVVVGVLAANVVILAAAALIRGPFDSTADIPLPIAVGLLGLALCGLVLVEQLYRNVSENNRWAVKFLCVGLGAIFVYDIYLYSSGMLVRELDANALAARGYINAIVIPLIAVSVARNPQLSMDIFVSRQVVFYGTAVTAVGVYLLAMAMGGYYIRVYGGSWGAMTQIVFLFGAVVLLALILLSSDARGKVKVFLVRHFFRNKYDYRLEWLRLIGELTRPSAEHDLQQRAIKSLAQIVSARGGCLWLDVAAAGRYERVRTWNMKAPAAIEEAGVSEYLAETQSVVVLRGRAATAGFTAPAWLAALTDAWLVVPLIHEDALLGFVVLEAYEQVPAVSWEDTEFLLTAGRQVASYLALDQAAERLSQSRQFEAYNKLAAFVIHDINNLVSQLSLVTQNAREHMDNPEFVRDAMRTVDNSVAKMNRLLEKLRRDTGGESRPTEVDLRSVVAEAVEACSHRSPVPGVHVEGDGLILRSDFQQLVMALRHLITNAQDAVHGTTGEVGIDVRRAQDWLAIAVSDNGEGMSEEFIQKRLFRCFDSTKQSRGMGIGAYEVREFVHSQGGRMEVDSRPGGGTVITVYLPAGGRPSMHGPAIEPEVSHG